MVNENRIFTRELKNSKDDRRIKKFLNCYEEVEVDNFCYMGWEYEENHVSLKDYNVSTYFVYKDNLIAICIYDKKNEVSIMKYFNTIKTLSVYDNTDQDDIAFMISQGYLVDKVLDSMEVNGYE